MASVRFSDVQSRPTEFLDLTSLTLEESTMSQTTVAVVSAMHLCVALTFFSRPRGGRVTARLL